jgi:hypothetical protein
MLSKAAKVPVVPSRGPLKTGLTGVSCGGIWSNSRPGREALRDIFAGELAVALAGAFRARFFLSRQSAAVEQFSN